MYETARDDSGYSKGKVLTISDFENVVKLKELKSEFIQNGKEVALGNSFGGTFSSVKCVLMGTIIKYKTFLPSIQCKIILNEL